MAGKRAMSWYICTYSDWSTSGLSTVAKYTVDQNSFIQAIIDYYSLFGADNSPISCYWTKGLYILPGTETFAGEPKFGMLL